MTVRELIMELEDFPQDAEVRLACQPAWPFEYSISSVVSVHPKDTDEEEFTPEEDDEESIIYIGEGSQIGYLPGQAANKLGWS